MVTTIFIDRAVGLLAIVLLAAAVAVIRLPFFLAWPQTRAALGFISVALAAAVLAFLLVLCRTRFQRWPFFRRVEQSTSLGAMAGRAYEAFHLCMAHPGMMGRVMGLSVLNQVGGVLLAMNLAAALNAARGFADMLSVTPVISAAASLPLTPGGLGTRETAAIYILETIGIPAPTALALSLLLYATGLAWSVIGGLVYVVYSLRVAPRGRAEPATAN